MSKGHLIYAGDVFLPVKSVDIFFNKFEGDIMYAYELYCKELGHNIPLETFTLELYTDYYFEQQLCLN